MADGDNTIPGEQTSAEVQANEHVKAFFLALAAKGKDAWNVWRRSHANEDVRVTFADIDFSQGPRDEIDFEGFEFGDAVDFSRCKWRGVEHRGEAFRRGRACFTGAVFGSEANFIGASFSSEAMFTGAALGDWASFVGAAFGIGADFRDVVFGDRANFAGAAFDDWADFNGAAFGWRANFAGATFGGLALFMDVVFGDEANFVVSAFGNDAYFYHVHFRGSVEFTGGSQEQWTREVQARAGWMDNEAGVALRKRHVESWMRESSGPDRFLNILFTNSRFDGETNFSGRAFERAADFTRARFYFPPLFDAATKDARIVFANAHIGFVPPGHFLHWTTDAKIPFRLRALRKIADETKNHDLERDLYIEERKAERGVYRKQLLEDLREAPRRQTLLIRWRLFTHWLWIGVMGLYWVLADYGRSFLVPTIWLGLSVPLFYWRYTEVLAPLSHEAGPANADKYNHAIWMLAFGNAVPFVGPLTIDAEIKKFLFCPGFGHCLPIPPEGFQCWVVFQNVVSIILVFFIGLALRNYFKIK
jgi:uncharacterized protein YjbI with pentapeptide repeats